MPNPLGEGRTYSIKVLSNAKPGDTFKYANGNEYTITDGGPNFVVRCFLCGATACATPETRMKDVRCGQCFARQSDLLPGQWAYEAKAKYAADHAPRRHGR